MPDLGSTMQYIGERYMFTPEHYPVLDQLAPKQRKAFAISHIAHHMSKSLGKISAECESFDHANQLNEASVKEATVKMFINTLKLAQELGMTPEDLMEAVPQLMKSKQQRWFRI
jgi:hypothetical protein